MYSHLQMFKDPPWTANGGNLICVIVLLGRDEQHCCMVLELALEKKNEEINIWKIADDIIHYTENLWVML